MEETSTETIILPIQPSEAETVHSNVDQSGDFSQQSAGKTQYHVQEQDVSQSSDNPEPAKQKRKKREKYIPDAVPLELPPCKICGKKASGNHYGVISCEACKGFFRRYLQRKIPYKCNKGGKCLENSTSKKTILCSACRMQKCLDCGMCREGIRQGRYTASERAHAIEEIKRFKQQNNNSSSQDIHTQSSDQALNLSSSSECLDLSLPKQGETVSASHAETAGINKVLSNSLGKEAGSNESFEVGKINTEMDILIENIVKGYHELNPHIMKLTDEEAIQIMKEGYKKHTEKEEMFGKMDPLPARVYSEIYKNTQMDIDGRMEIFQVIKEELATLIQEYVRYTHGIPGFSNLPPTDQARLLKDRCELDARDQVEKIQMLFIEAIQYLLKKRVKDEGGVHFSKIMNVFLKLREMNEEFLTFYKKMCEDPMIQKYMPELLHFLIE
ncbi:probable nuclear hormone receptor HR3 isoform X2 [Saccostrea cucullata]|uniref:probable nuclear hormone receptor HR3 isoform X2 n=1 Tax=Saccostrea cuccullata TaxID=36930 RepID=UPI002ED48F9D